MTDTQNYGRHPKRTSTQNSKVTSQDARGSYAQQIAVMNPYERHKRFIMDYVQYYGRNKPINVSEKTDWDILKEEYRFIRTDTDNDDKVWAKHFAAEYYSKLYRNYCLANFSQYTTGKVGLRWRTQDEVFSGKGQFVCGADDCTEKENLNSYEVNFAYKEAGERKQALVKLRVCPTCAEKLYYKKKKEEEEKKPNKKKKQEKKNEKKRNLENSPENHQKRRRGEEGKSNTVIPVHSNKTDHNSETSHSAEELKKPKVSPHPSLEGYTDEDRARSLLKSLFF